MSVGKFLWIIFFIFQCSYALLPNSSFSDSKNCQNRTPAKEYAAPPEPIVIVPGNHFYADSENSVIDESLYSQNEKARKPLRKYLDQIIIMTENAVQGDQDASLVVNKWFLNWAEGDALTKVESQQGGFERKWLLSGLLITYLANKPYSGWQQQEKIENWFNRLTHLMMKDYQGYQKNSQRNNHVYWAGLVALEMSLINSDPELMNWGLEKIRYGLAQIDKNGFLPLELERKSKALQYHRVSLEALTMAAYLLKQRGFNLLNEYDDALERLAEITLRGLSAPEIFELKTGVKQEYKMNDSTAWVSIYAQLNPESSQVTSLIKTTQPNWNRALGGRPIELFEKQKNRSVRCEGLF